MTSCYRWFVYVVLVVGLSLSFALSAAVCELKVRIPNFEPLAMRDDQGNWHGIDVDQAKALLDQAGCSYRFIEMPFARGIHKLQRGELDMMREISKTPERQKTLYFVGPQRLETTHLIIKKGLVKPPITAWQQLKTLDLALLLQRGTYAGERFEQVLIENPQLKKRLVFLGESGFRIDLIKKGRIDGFFAEKLYLQYRLRSNPDYAMVELHPLVISSAPVYFAFSKLSVN
ncbi:MAG: transporter substrate-binding domain-containing protein, partial [Psychrosphaera sp.]|nr:transporter substrate-binding domain-containing protein [Psychrosphaera sp.]